MLIDHVDMRVQNLTAVRPLYDALLAAMGYTERNSDDESVGYHRPNETGAEPFIWLIESRDHRPGETRIAFAAASRAEVDRLSRVACAAGATAYEAPAVIREYGPYYYASFFEDPQGNKLEIACRRPE
jgi:catechol 2,3-dioxygenase-like lactoylglutathione lyase family enzyme